MTGYSLTAPSFLSMEGRRFAEALL